jgi:hypothetical protein
VGLIALQVSEIVGPNGQLDPLPSIAAERPSLWAITDGSGCRLDKSSSDPHVMDGGGGSTNLLQSLLENGAAMRAALGK